jgi:hypothetical protein
MTRYFRAMAVTASTADLAVTFAQLAAHYERLARAAMPSGDISPEPAEHMLRRGDCAGAAARTGSGEHPPGSNQAIGELVSRGLVFQNAGVLF